jgi:hypothetical protein
VAVRARYATVASCALATVIGGNHWLVLEHGDAIGRLCERFISGRALDEPERAVTARRIQVETIPAPAYGG